jgi:hypothetical protein
MTSDSSEIQKLSSSRAMLRISDAVLGLDRRDLSRLVAAYLHFKSEGKSDRDLLQYLLTNELDIAFRLGLNILPAIVAGLFGDGDFRALVFDLAASRVMPRHREPQG